MPQATLFAPDVTCDHCIATIQKAVDSVEGARFLAGDPDSRSFAVDIAEGALLDRLAEVLASEGYPLGEARPVASGTPASATGMGSLPMAGLPNAGAHGSALPMAQAGGAAPAFQPAYQIGKSDAGALVVYNCPCGSTTEEYSYDRSLAEQAVGSCCGHHLLIQPGAAERLRGIVGDGYQVSVQTLEMPWGQPVEAAFASRG
ncbi:MAG: copper chaperone [Chloroflexi bacterium]|nr:heavy-metal-associated domain-containing protein [Chloroflexota bacterium]MQC18123.1 copper chaperone [Chloroflexota bacterium]